MRFGSPAEEGKLELGRWQLRSGKVFKKLLMNNFVPTCTVVVRKVCADDTGRFDTTPALRSAEDYEYWMRLASRYSVQAVHHPLARYRVSSDNISKDLAARLGPEALALQHIETKLHPSKALMNRALASLYLRLFRYTVASDPGTAYGHLQQSWTLQKGRFQTLLYQLLYRLTGPSGCARWIAFERSLKQRIS